MKNIQVRTWIGGGCITIAAALGLGALFRLGVGYTVVMMAGMLLLLPGIFFYGEGYRREQRRFLEVSIYMEQVLYAFKGTQKILNALEDVLFLFPEGLMHQRIASGIRVIELRAGKEQAEQLALRQLEEAYPCEQLRHLHRFLLHVEAYGGDFSNGIDLMLRDCQMFAERAEKMMKERQKCRRDILLSSLLAVGICLFSQYMLPRNIEISSYPFTRCTTVVLVLANMLFLLLALRQLSGNLFQNSMADAYARKKYSDCKNYREEQAAAKSFCISLVPFGLSVVLAFLGYQRLCMCGIAAGILLLLQHKLGHWLAMRTVRRELSKAFPQWLMQMGLLLQTENVQVSIEKSVLSAPAILQPALQQMIQELEYQPESEAPFLNFLHMFQMREVSSAMRMLYSLAAGTGGNPAEQISALVQKIQNTYNRAKVLEQEDQLAGMYMLFLAPSAVGMLKLASDMAMFVVAYFQI